MHILSIHIYKFICEFIYEFIYEFIKNVFIYEFKYEFTVIFTCVNMNSYKNSWTVYFLVHPKSYVFFHDFIYE